MENYLLTTFVIITFWGLVGLLVDYLRKRGSKLAEDKPIYNKIRWGIYIFLSLLATIFIIFAFVKE